MDEPIPVEYPIPEKHTRGRGKLVDMTGKTNGRFDIIGESPEPSQYTEKIWRCKCRDCGYLKDGRGWVLRNRKLSCPNCDSRSAWNKVSDPIEHGNERIRSLKYELLEALNADSDDYEIERIAASITWAFRKLRQSKQSKRLTGERRSL